MSALRHAARRRSELNPITTSLDAGIHQPQHQHLQTPSSALSANSLGAQFGYNPQHQQYTPVSAVRQYNPQQWTPPPSITPDSGAHPSAGRPQDPEVVIPAPPPYSPPRSNRTSMIASEESSSGNSPATRLSPANVYRSSPELSSNPVFPPPPPPPTTRSRAPSSHDRPQSIFGINSSFARRPPPEAPRLSPEISRENGFNARRPLPIQIDALSSEEENPLYTDPRAPASRRAASTGAIVTPSSSRSRGSSTSRWEPGMPLPPPPPGPPPPGSRSQSMSRTDRLVSPPTRRPGHMQMSSLGPVPPTPAGWVDEDITGRGRSPHRGLQIDTSNISSSTLTDSNSGSTLSGLARTHAVRGEPKTIRERRTASKTRRGALSPEGPSNNPWAESIVPSDIVVLGTGLARKPTINRSTPRSGRSHQGDAPKSPDGSMNDTPIQNGPGTRSRGTTPRPPHSASRSDQSEAPTPPFSPGLQREAYMYVERSPAIPPKALPTPPPSKLTVHSPPGQSIRPVSSHNLHMLDNDVVAAPPLLPSRPASRHSNSSQLASSSNQMPRTSSADQFARSAIERHQVFAQREAAATSDGERVRIFAHFIVAESRLRREKYAIAIDAMGSEILELTRDLFRPQLTPHRESNVSRGSSVWTPESSTNPTSPGLSSATRSHRGSLVSALRETPKLQTSMCAGNSAGNSAGPSSSSGPTSPAVGSGGRPESTWFNGYMPSLSPIPSMSVSDALDGSDSRGRPSSRWWEVGDEGSQGTPSMRLERSKRESKYMGMPKELREALQNGDPDVLATSKSLVDMGEPSAQRMYGDNEYPPEKSGWHEEHDGPSSSEKTPSKLPPVFSPALKTPNTPNLNHLDVSRLVTLPPPYPRHHPAVNNNHPDLSSIRTIVRTLSDFTEIEATRSRFSKTSAQIREDLASEASKRRSSLRQTIQRQIASGTMSYAEAAAAESQALESETEKTKEASKVEFDLFQTQVVAPLNGLIMDRISRAITLFTQLRGKLFVDAQEQNPNQTQEEGDEQPELLEKLTLLKWIFEAREQLHRELFDLLSDRNDRYRDMVITPYRLSGATEKVKNAEIFFAEDASKRKLAQDQEVLKRTEEFMDIIEENVVRGVEVQLSAFWDIAPGLSRIIERIPRERGDLYGFKIQIPASEYEENPQYYEYPMQYLYSLLVHCQKSTYQFIESQTNLLCLLHEVKETVTLANCRLMKTQRLLQGEEEAAVETELKEVEKDEEIRLTDDLKEKVRCVEEQWSSALGAEMIGVKERLKGFLLEVGGWDDSGTW